MTYRSAAACRTLLCLFGSLCAGPALAQSSGCDSYVTAVQALETANFKFHADLRGLADASGAGGGAFQFWVNPATAEWILLELGVGSEAEGLKGCIKLSGRDYKEFDIGLTQATE